MIKCIKDNSSPTGFTITIEGETNDIMEELARIGSEIYNAALVGLEKVKTGIEETYEYCELEPGDHFYYNEYEYVLLDIVGKGDYLAITADISDYRQFHGNSKDGCNNWANSHLRRYLNDEYMDEMGIEPEHVIECVSDLTADNGDKSYGKCKDYIFLLSCDLYRKYREIIPKYKEWVWTLTPTNCNASTAYYVRIIHPPGALNYNHYATSSIGVAPACIFNHEILIPRRQAQTGRTVLEEATGDDGED